MLFLYTDGVTEAVNRDGEQFRMAAPARDRTAFGRPLAAGADAGGDRRASRSFSAGTLQADDITCLVVRRNG